MKRQLPLVILVASLFCTFANAQQVWLQGNNEEIHLMIHGTNGQDVIHVDLFGTTVSYEGDAELGGSGGTAFLDLIYEVKVSNSNGVYRRRFLGSEFDRIIIHTFAGNDAIMNKTNRPSTSMEALAMKKFRRRRP